MPFSAPRLIQQLAALRAAGVVLPPKPRIEFPRPVVEGRPPTLEDVTAQAAYQRVIDAWIAKVNNLYFRHFGVAER
jgi:hypothetical protein